MSKLDERIAKMRKDLAKLEALAAQPPQPLATPNWEHVIREVKEYVTDDEARKDRLQRGIFENAVVAVYGPGIWDYLNKRGG